jgi:hypothetical protein
MERLFSLGNKFGEHRSEFRRNGGQKISACAGDQSADIQDTDSSPVQHYWY